MKKTQLKNLLKSIKKSGVSFFAVAFIAATSIAIYCGLMFSADAELQSADRYFNEQRLANFEVTGANGITQDDVDALVSSGTVTEAEGGYTAMAAVEGEEENVLVQVRSRAEKVNQPVLVSGELPEARNEIAVEEMMADKKGVAVGDTLRLSHDGMLYETEFTVTGIVNEPGYSCTKIKDARGRTEQGLGVADFFVETSAEAFDPEYYHDSYPVAYLRDSRMEGLYYFSDEYTASSDTLKKDLETFGEERAEIRYEELRSEADEKLADARADLDAAQQELADGKQKINDGKQELADGKQELADKEQEIADGWEELESQEATLDDSQEQILASLAEQGMGDDMQAAYDTLNSIGHPLAETLAAYLDGRAAADEARRTLEDGEAELADARTEIADAEQELADAEAEYADAEQELADAEAEYADAEADAAEIEKKDWVVLARDEMGDVRGIESVVEGMRGLSYSMAIIFLIVAVVICYASVSRLISEQRVLIGAQKALGFSSGEILRHYMVYNILCAVLGIVLGLLFAVVIVELLVLYVAYADAFLFKDVRVTFMWKDALISAVLCFLVFLVATYGACAKLVKTPATQLLRGEMPVKGRSHFFEKWKCYQRLSLYNKAMIKNVLQDKGRAAVTIMGVVGSIALLVICFSMKFAIENAPVRQYDDYYHYNQRLVVDSEKGDVEEFRALLDGEDVPYAQIQEKVKAFRVDGGSYSTVHVVATTDPEALAEWVRIEDISNKEEISIPAEGVLISRRCAEKFELEAGDTIEISDEEGNPVAFEVAGVIEHYLPTHLFYMSPEYYESRMGEPIDECVFLVKDVPETVTEQARQMDGFLSLNDNSGEFGSASNLTLVIIICLVLSAVMALLVLLNQGVMYINRKARELAVMRVNGFSLKQTRAYVYKDNIVLTALGLLLGSAAGVGLSYIIIRFLEVEASRYVRDANGLACLLACLVGSVFALIVNLMALRRVNHLSLTNVSGN